MRSHFPRAARVIAITAICRQQWETSQAVYPLGLIIAPLYRFAGWKEGYRDLLEQLEATLAYCFP
ncbi:MULTISPECIES: spore photoproduct lyase family protein [Bacillales]|jgi:hypothetical protein|uniref:Uncharacterized protein n=1 Tax=Aneurinibacillus thermoaerophilus TaxID=143495 RepID=A0ABX8Y7Z8_ANETH|nr:MULTISPECIES: hypothetical protein [Bacillales]AMA72495.1 hypothetical protein ACH33_06280 [Aneurinibacillus sp. XH2]MDE1399024.1 hypothetical protein [Bacillus licheniformis]MED0675618.1 hypothetical protein [Aneurinibacillus thermoaerophilus]MED0679981.1 hypothetical protein [Aneurinibacillus thermoaerophilus]MED0735519.1 hypothetical protein [Aneurinibacillus thermoaerophilus]